jgi:hypothetical protein
MLIALSIALFLTCVDGHGSMITPPSRNSIDAETPAWSNGKHPNTGELSSV